MGDRLNSTDIAIGAAIRAARFSRGLTQGDLAARIGVTRAAIASYETGRRKILAETLLRIAHLCDQPLSFFDPDASSAATQPPPAMPSPQQSAIQAVVQALELRLDIIPRVLETLETVLESQVIAKPNPSTNAPPGTAA
jgi:transcriptional regulator with XRE-family HTH domain